MVELLPESARGKMRSNDDAVDCKARSQAGEMDQEACKILLNDHPHPPKVARGGSTQMGAPRRDLLFEQDWVAS